MRERLIKIYAEDMQERHQEIDRVPNSLYGEFIYTNPQYQIFSGNRSTYLGEGQNGIVYAVQNVLTAQWYCMKRSKKIGTNELHVLSEEGMLLSFEKGKKEDIVICELIQGKNLKKMIDDISKEKEFFYQQSKLDHEQKMFLNDGLSKIFSFEQALAINISVIEAYESLHRKKYIHRDIKPENIIFNSALQKSVTIDFGFVNKVGKNTVFAGTPMYIDPETIFYDKSQRKFFFHAPKLANDIYAMGMTAAEILALAIDHVALYSEEDLQLYYENLFVDTLDLTKDQYHYLKRVCQCFYPDSSRVKTFIKFYLRNFAIIFGAKSSEYQERRKLSVPAIALCQLICQMTGPIESRPDISMVLEKMRQIRLEHIQNRMKLFKPALEDKDSYNNILKELYETRQCLRNSLEACDDLEKFLLQAVDINEKNRKTIEELSQYRVKLNGMLNLKKGLNKEIQEYSSKTSISIL